MRVTRTLLAASARTESTVLCDHLVPVALLALRSCVPGAHASRLPGNFFRLHKRKPDPSATHGQGLDPLDARGGSLPNDSPAAGSHGLAIAYVHFRVKPGASAGIARFYREVFGADAEEIAVSTPSGETCSLVRVLCVFLFGGRGGGRGHAVVGALSAEPAVGMAGPCRPLV